MRITWNQSENRFEAQFAQGEEWKRDQSAASASGFHTNGSPQWIWYASKASVLDKLKKQIPVGIVLTRDALEAYNRLHAIEQKNAELKAWGKEQQKKLKRQEERAALDVLHEKDGEVVEPEYEPSHFYAVPDYWQGKDEITRSDLPADYLARFDKHESIPQRRADPIGTCLICGDNMYYPEGPTCLWCEGKGEDEFFKELIV